MRRVEFKLLWAIIVGLTMWSCEKDKSNSDDDNQEGEAQSADIVWQQKLSIPINPALGSNYMPAIDENDNIYVMMSDWNNYGSGEMGNVLQAFDKNGNALWERSTAGEDPDFQMVTYYENKLYFTTGKKIVCLDAEDGSDLWNYNVPDSFLVSYSLVIANNRVLTSMQSFDAENSYLFAFDSENGTINSTLAITDDRAVMAMAAKGSTVYLTYDFLYSVNVTSSGLSLNWKTVLPGNSPEYGGDYKNIADDIAIAPNGNIIFTYGVLSDLSTRRVICYSSGGTELWQSDNEARHLVVDADNDIYLCNDDLIKLDGASGSEIWSTSAPAETFGLGSFRSVTVGTDEVMYNGDYFGIYAAENTGNLKYYTPAATVSETGPLTYITLLSNGNIILLCMGDDEDERGILICMKGSSGGVQDEIWAKWGCNAANTFNLED